MNIEILTLIIRLGVVIIAGVLVPIVQQWINAKTENEKYARIKAAADTAVLAAEQIYNKVKKIDPTGTARKESAKKAVVYAANTIGMNLTDDEVNDLIEAAVQELNIVKSQEKAK